MQGKQKTQLRLKGFTPKGFRPKITREPGLHAVGYACVSRDLKLCKRQEKESANELTFIPKCLNETKVWIVI